MSLATMIASIRKALKDDRYVVNAFTVSCSDTGVTSAMLEIVSGRLVTTLLSGNATALDLDLSLAVYSTVGKLQEYISKQEGYSATQLQGMEEDFPSLEIEATGPMDIMSVGYDLRTRVFSDTELEMYVSRSTQRHNPSLTVSTIPTGEEHLVITLCQGELMRALANDSVRRKNLDMTVSQLIQLAELYEQMYQSDMARLARVISPPRETSDTVGVGDVMVGDFVRMSKRTGVAFPTSSPLGYDCPVTFMSAGEQILGDVNVTLKWSRKRSSHTWRMEVWRDTAVNVRRTNDQLLDPTTSVKVLDDRNIVRDSYKDTGLEPATTYYYRIYIIDTTGEFVQSEVLTALTLAERVHFGANPIVTPTQGPATTSLAIKLTTFPVNTVVKLGGKVLTGSWVSGVFTSTVPAFTQKGLKDVVVVSPVTALFEVLKDAFTVT